MNDKLMKYGSCACFVLAAVCLILAMTGCGTRLTDGQAEQLAQARADVVAARTSTDQAASYELLQASAARQMAAVADLSLPEPMTPVSALVAADGAPHMAAIASERKAADAAEIDPPSGWAGAVLAWAGGAGLLVLGAMRLSPGIFGAVSDLAYGYLAPLANRQIRQRQQQATVVAEHAVAYGAAITATATAAGLGPQVEMIKDSAAETQDRLGIRDQVQAILASLKTSHAEPSNSG